MSTVKIEKCRECKRLKSESENLILCQGDQFTYGTPKSKERTHVLACPEKK